MDANTKPAYDPWENVPSVQESITRSLSNLSGQLKTHQHQQQQQQQHHQQNIKKSPSVPSRTTSANRIQTQASLDEKTNTVKVIINENACLAELPHDWSLPEQQQQQQPSSIQPPPIIDEEEDDAANNLKNNKLLQDKDSYTTDYDDDADVNDYMKKISKNKNNQQDVDENSLLFLDAGQRKPNCYERAVGFIQSAILNFLSRNIKTVMKSFLIFVFLAYNAYFIYANYYTYTSHKDFSRVESLNTLTGLAYGLILISIVSKYFGAKIGGFVSMVYKKVSCKEKWQRVFQIAVYLSLLAGIIIFLIIDVGLDSLRLRSALGMVILVKIVYITSTNPSRVKWKPVIWGLVIQILLGFIILRWEKGYAFFQLAGNKTETFLSFADNGSIFVFGEKGLIDHPMAMQVFPIVIYFSAITNILYYWGVMQWIVKLISWLMQYTMGTTAIETLNAAMNIFIGMAESCVVLRPFLPRLTKSELHAVMTGGFATVAGSYIALLISVGAESVHLMSAAIMSAPAALAIAKLSYPETEESHTKTEEGVYLENMPAKNFMEAASNGAIAAIKIVASVAANLIAILGLLTFINSLLSWFGAFVDHPEFSFEIMCSYLFFPLAVIMGVPIEDAKSVAQIIGKKIFVDELLSFQELVALVKNGDISERGAMIATYACCGFGSIAAIGVYIGAMAAVAPSMKSVIVEIAPRAMINGNIAGFMTACIAGVLHNGDSFHKNTTPDLNGPAIESSLCPCCPCLGNYSIIWWQFVERWVSKNGGMINNRAGENFSSVMAYDNNTNYLTTSSYSPF